MLRKFAAAGIVTAAAAGVMLLAGPANADVNTVGTGNVPVVVPINAPINAPISVPTDVCGNNVQVVGSLGLAGCKGGNNQGSSGY